MKSFIRSRFLLPLVVAVIQVAGAFHETTHEPSGRDLDGWGFALLLAGPVVLTIRRYRPREVLAFVFATMLAYHWLDYPPGPVAIALVVAFVSAFFHGYRVFAWAMLGLTYFSVFWLGWLLGIEPRPEFDAAFGAAAWMLAFFAFFEVGRGRRERAIEASRVRREERKRRASEERLRIAQELHDVLGHNLSLINVQAGSALHLMEERPEQARTALAAIKDASNDALRDLRSALDVLRDGEEAPRSPTPDLSDLDDLMDRTATTGLEVRKEVSGEERPLPAGIERAAFRIAQEALTNVTRHAQAQRVTISVVYRPDELLVSIADDGRGAANVEGGTGIEGMRDRATALGGDLHAGSGPVGGFVVKARLPIPDGDPA